MRIRRPPAPLPSIHADARVLSPAAAHAAPDAKPSAAAPRGVSALVVSGAAVSIASRVGWAAFSGRAPAAQAPSLQTVSLRRAASLRRLRPMASPWSCSEFSTAPAICMVGSPEPCHNPTH